MYNLKFHLSVGNFLKSNKLFKKITFSRANFFFFQLKFIKISIGEGRGEEVGDRESE